MKKVYVKEEVCIACHLCEVYCQLHHARSKDLIKAFKREARRPVPRVRVEEKEAVSFSIRCQQCDEAPCVQACLTGAMTREGITEMVEVDRERCIGCWTCILVCPYGAIVQDTQENKALKCDLCEGENVPVCVSNCPNEALVYLESHDGSLSREKAI